MHFNYTFNPCAVLVQDRNIIIINFIRYEVFVMVLPETDEERQQKIVMRKLNSYD